MESELQEAHEKLLGESIPSLRRKGSESYPLSHRYSDVMLITKIHKIIKNLIKVTDKLLQKCMLISSGKNLSKIVMKKVLTYQLKLQTLMCTVNYHV